MIFRKHHLDFCLYVRARKLCPSANVPHITKRDSEGISELRSKSCFEFELIKGIVLIGDKFYAIKRFYAKKKISLNFCYASNLRFVN